MTLWLVFGGVAALLIYIAVAKAKAKKSGRIEAEGEHMANYAETAGEINDEIKRIDAETNKLEPETDEEWDDFFANGRHPSDGLDELRKKPRDQG